MIPYGRHSVDESDIAAVSAVLRGDWLTTGPVVDEFERALSGHAGGVPCVSVTSGTTALHVAYAAAGIGPGDEVVVTPMTFVATAAAAAMLGARVVFADVEQDTANLDPAAAEAAITTRTKVVTAIDYAGHPADWDAFRKITEGRDILLLDDAAHALGSRYRGRPIGSAADLTTFSFFPTKNVTTAEGGAVAVADLALLPRVRMLRNHGLVRDPLHMRWPDEGGWHQEVHAFSLNYRLPDLLCALGVSQLRRLESFKAERARLAARYAAMLDQVEGIRLPVHRQDVEVMAHLYPIRVLDGRRKEIYQSMRRSGIGVQVNYVPVYWHPVFSDQGYRRGLCPNAERFYAEELSLPLYPGLTDQQQGQVVDGLVAALKGRA
ncbi:DegT/DnrJ/EryC1/StrS aminotransferase family protein [Nonomuraea sp. NBC_01738]|nr:DegT/DnrJ/EryC1/StrS aminotransferase family protein [Nonomuraea sp. NBC_01738]